jgi:hypothetical protein
MSFGPALSLSNKSGHDSHSASSLRAPWTDTKPRAALCTNLLLGARKSLPLGLGDLVLFQFGQISFPIECQFPICRVERGENIKLPRWPELGPERVAVEAI